MTDDKKTSRVTIRFGEELYRLAVEMQKERGAADISDYVRGLIVAEAVNAGRSTKGVDLPGWINGQLVRISRAEAPAPGPPTGGGRAAQPKEDSPKAPAARR